MYNLNMQTINYLRFLPEITRRILAVSDPEKIILFGSYARGDNTTDSDLDLLVVMKYVESPRSESIRLRRALRGLLVPVDVIVVTTEQMDRYGNTAGLIYQSAQAEGKLVYERPIAG
jgi:predicted nucleotidyltransferase